MVQAVRGLPQREDAGERGDSDVFNLANRSPGNVRMGEGQANGCFDNSASTLRLQIGKEKKCAGVAACGNLFSRNLKTLRIPKPEGREARVLQRK
jgi:hypothetical protein